MKEVTKERLLKAAWSETRKINIREIREKYQKIGIRLPECIERFLEIYGLLIFNDKHRKEDLEFIPDNVLGSNLDKEYFEELLEEYNIKDMVYPVGTTCRGNLMILMTEQETFYCFTDGYLEKAGENVEEMLDCLVGECNEAEVID